MKLLLLSLMALVSFSAFANECGFKIFEYSKQGKSYRLEVMSSPETFNVSTGEFVFPNGTRPMECAGEFDRKNGKPLCYSVVARNGRFYWYTESGLRGEFLETTPELVDLSLGHISPDGETAVIQEGKRMVMLQPLFCK